MRSQIWIGAAALALGFSTLAISCGGEDGPGYLDWTKEEAQLRGGRDGDIDVCLARGWYGDGECDRFCPIADDVDCRDPEAVCLSDAECGDGRYCDTRECLYCCPDAPPGTACIEACCGVCRARADEFEPCFGNADCESDEAPVCDRSECLSCCPLGSESEDCVAACCGRCVAPPMDTCERHADCTFGAEWCVEGECLPCDNTGLYCDLACPGGLVDPVNGCQPCRCKPTYDPCTSNAQCDVEGGELCDLSECLSCCPDAAPGDPCIAACCGRCVTAPEAVECERDADCVFGRQWCVEGECVPCDNSGLYCDRACPGGLVDPINGCQPCRCRPTYKPCMGDDQCDRSLGEVCDQSECVSCCPNAAPGEPCIAACCGRCVVDEEPAVCDADADCEYGREWCVDGECVPCDNSGLACLIACELVDPINGCQPCECKPDYEPCTSDAECGVSDAATSRVCDRSECLSCCPGARPGEPCVDACCGRCVDRVEPTACETDADCGYGREWCVDGECAPCDNSGLYCDLYCEYGFVEPINGCQPCECQPAYKPCTRDAECGVSADVASTQVCDLSECLSCCPGADPGEPCVDMCCGRCVDRVEPVACDTDADCETGRQWCVDGECVPCDNSGRYCDLYCPFGFVDPINGCQPCRCKPAYEPCTSNADCGDTVDVAAGQVCDKSECLSCCPGADPGEPCIALCCGYCRPLEPSECVDHSDCERGREWCVDGECVPCDNSGLYCDLYCEFGFVEPINGCQPCECNPPYKPCVNDADCDAGTCDHSECLSCCPGSVPGTACIDLCCGRCVE